VITALALALVQLSLDSQLGTSRAPYVTTALPQVSGYGAVFELDAQWWLRPRLHVGGRAALALLRIEQPAGALYAEAAWANPELNIALEQPLVDERGWALRLSPQLAVGLPLAEHDSVASQLEGRALVLANAFQGFGEPELFTPGVLPVTPSASIELQSARWCFAFALKTPLLLRVTDASLPAESDARAFGFVPVLDATARFQPWRWLALGLGPRLTWRALPPVDDHGAPLQPFISASAEFYLAGAVSAALSLSAPFGGPLGGSTLAGGLRLGARF
jgi:hypothetical protein